MVVHHTLYMTSYSYSMAINFVYKYIVLFLMAG